MTNERDTLDRVGGLLDAVAALVNPESAALSSPSGYDAGIEAAAKGPRKIYVASSWRCKDQPRIVALLRDAGHEVYDFRNPAPGNTGFAWSAIDPDWLGWEPAAFAKLLEHPIAQSGFALDKQALDWCDTCVLVLPCGRSAHLEAGYTAGQGKPTIFYLSPDKFEPELMYLLGDGCVTTDDELLAKLRSLLNSPPPTGERESIGLRDHQQWEILVGAIARYNAGERDADYTLGIVDIGLRELLAARTAE